MLKTFSPKIFEMLVLGLCSLTWATYPVVRPQRTESAPDAGRYTILPNQEKQVVWGLGFEIQSDSIASANAGLPDAFTSVPHDLTRAERKRLADEMLKGFRYCRLAGGLYFRGTDPEKKYLQPRWPEQLEELKELLDMAGVEGLSFEYFSPPPFWKANRQYRSKEGAENILRCFGKDFPNDPVYHGDVEAFLQDYAQACVRDIQTLEKAGFKISMWGLSNEPFDDNIMWSSCVFNPQHYSTTFKAVAPAIRKHNPSITIIADTDWGWPRCIAPVMKEPEYAQYVDALVVHAIGDDSRRVLDCLRQTRANIKQELPLFQNEYEYLQGPASADRCHNTVQNIMNWYQLVGSPSWFWLHVLKPLKNAEASGYSLGYWMPIDPDYASTHNAKTVSNLGCPRTSDRFSTYYMPKELAGLFYVTINRGASQSPAPGYTFRINKKAKVYLAVQNCGEPTMPAGWSKTDLGITWDDQRNDTVYVKTFDQGLVTIPGHNGKNSRGTYGVPNMAFIEDVSGETVVVRISDVPEKLGGKMGTVVTMKEDTPDTLKPGHWTWNKYNWHSMVGFLKHMPWDCRVVEVQEDVFDDDMRILAYKRPDGKLVIMLSNRCFKDYTFKIDTGLQGQTFQGYRYTPDETGEDYRGVPVGAKKGDDLEIAVPDLAWEFWIEQ